ncbi:MAG: cyclic nucleotide-binding domain-containing protein [Pseudomonadota bacterium]
MRKALFILGDLEDRDLIWLSEAGGLRQLAPGEALVEAGREISDLFFVTDGSFTVTFEGRRIAELGTGDVVGEMSFVEKRPPSTTVTALAPSRVLAVPRGAMLQAFRSDPAMAARFYRALAVFLSDRLRTTMEGDQPVPGLGNGELDEGLLDTLHVAGDRMVRLIDLLEGRAR